MARRITHKRLSGGSGHEHIVAVAWVNDVSTSSTLEASSTAEMVAWIEVGHSAYTLVNGRRAEVGVRQTSTGRKFLQTHADGYWNDNLLALPDF